MGPSLKFVAAVAIALGAGASGPLATAQPTVVVRAEARIELRAAHDDGTITVDGTLVDDLGEPMARRSLTVSIHRPDGRTLYTARQTTDADGAFAFSTPGGPSRYTLTASYEGDDFHPRLSVERRADLSRAPTRLRLDVGDGRINLDSDEIIIGVEAGGPRGGAGLDVALLDELGRELATGRTDGEGRLTMRLRSEELGESGDGRLVARTEGDARRAEARVEAPVVRYRRPTLTLEASRESMDPAGEVTLRGALTTSAGPLASEAIGIFASDTHLDTALTDGTGHFEVVTDGASLGLGIVPVEARFESDGPGTPAAASEPVSIEVRGGARSVWAWLGLPLGLSLLVLLWLRRRAPPSEVPAPLEPEPIGVIAGAPVRRGPARRVVSGRLEDLRGQPLRGRVRASKGEREERIACDEDGSFSMELEDGRWTLAFEAARHAPAESAVDIPHRGSFEGLRVRLETWRARALAILRERFTARGGPARWAKTTVHSLTDDGDLGPIAAEVEVSYYGPMEPDARRIEALQDDRPSPPST